MKPQALPTLATARGAYTRTDEPQALPRHSTLCGAIPMGEQSSSEGYRGRSPCNLSPR